jgi:hypothetical protein
MKYQNLGKSPFNTHATIMSTFIVATYLYTGVLVAISRVTRAIPNRSYLPIAMLFYDILCYLACSLLVFILFPPIGGFLLFSCTLVFIRALHNSYWQIFELLNAFKCQVFSKFQYIFSPPHQASNGNSMEQEGNGGVSTMVWIVKKSSIISVYFSCCFVVVPWLWVFFFFFNKYCCCILFVTYC